MKSSLKLITTLPIVALGLGNQNLEAKDKPNVILILADDMGYSGISSFGGIGLETPALDKLAANGVVCTNFHTNAPVCSPTRVSILTGSYQQRAGLNSIYQGKGVEDGLDPKLHPSFVKQLKSEGYRTGIFGKWHLGINPRFNPVYQGFDEFRGFLIGNIDMISHRNRMNQPDWWHNTIAYEEEGYATHLYNKYAVDFIRSKGKPFFLYVTHGAIHTPIQAPGDQPIRDGVNPPVYDNAKDLPDGEYQRRYREMVKSIDEGLQQIIEELKKQGQLNNTLIIFTSDNGAEPIADKKYFGANGFFNGAKNTLYEGGTRVPAIFYHPQSLPHHRTNEMMMSMDLMPTILEFCGIQNKQKIDGTSLLPSLKSYKPMPERDIFWANVGWLAMQSGDWKMVSKGNSSELFNLLIDPKEQHDLSSIYPERIESMKTSANNWWKNVTKGTKLEGTSPLNMDLYPRAAE